MIFQMAFIVLSLYSGPRNVSWQDLQLAPGFTVSGFDFFRAVAGLGSGIEFSNPQQRIFFFGFEGCRTVQMAGRARPLPWGRIQTG